MVVYVTLTIATVFMAWYVKNQDYVTKNIEGKVEKYFERQQMLNLFIFLGIGILLIFVSAGRVAVGNDYWVYRQNFLDIVENAHVSSEIGFNSLVKVLFWIFGYDNYKAIFGFFSIATILLFMKAFWDQGEWFFGTFFLFMTGGFYFNSMNSVRYYFVVALCLYSMKYVIRKEYLKFILFICFAALFHKSALIVIPIYILSRFFAERKIPKWLYVFLGIFIGSMICFQNVYRRIIFFFYPYYENSAFDHGNISFINILKCVGVMILGIICYKVALKDNIKNRFYFLLNVGALILYVFGSFIPEISRIGYYLLISQIFLIPNMLIRVKRKGLKIFLTIGVFLFFLLYFVFFLKKAPDDGIRLLPYFNWILGA